MRAFMPFLVIGLATGSVYALAAMGLVVTYTTSGVFNFAHGAVGMAAAYVFYWLREEQHVPTALAIAVAVGVAGPLIGVVIDRVLLRRLTGSPAATYIVVSLGLLVAIQGLAIVIYGTRPRPVAPLFPTSSFRLPGINVGWDQAILVLLSAGVGLMLAGFFQRSHLGLQMRAVVDDPELTGLMGASASRIRTLSWMLGCGAASLAAVLLSPLLGVEPTILTLLVIQAFGAAAAGRLVNLPLTYAGGLAIGVLAAVSTKYVAQHPALAGIPTSLPFLVLFAVLLASSKGSFAEFVKVTRGARRSIRAPRRLPLIPLAGCAAVAASLPPFLSSSRQLTATNTVAFVLVFSSLGLLVGLSRQVSLCHAIFVVFGATTLSHLQSAGVPYLLALMLAALAVVPIGALLAVPAIRLSGLFLALATFGFGVLAQNLLFGTDLVFGSDKVTVAISRPSIFGISLEGDRALYYFTLTVVVLGVLIVEAIRVSRLGRLLRSLADSPVAVESLGINPVASRVLVFCVTAFLAALAGGLLGTMSRSVSTSTFDFSSSLLWITVLGTAGAATFGGAVLASVLLSAVPAFITSIEALKWLPVFFGVGAILLVQAPNGLATLFRWPDFTTLAERYAWRLDRRRLQERVTG